MAFAFFVSFSFEQQVKKVYFTHKILHSFDFDEFNSMNKE